MRRLVLVGLAVLLVLALGFAAAAIYEVASLGQRLGATIGRLEPPPVGRPSAPAGPPPPGPRATPAPPAEDGAWTHVQFTVTAEDLGRLLSRSDARLGGAMARERSVEAHLADGHIVLTTRNRFALGGLTLAAYGGYSDWRVAVLDRAVGVALADLRVAGLPVPFAGAMVRALSRRSGGGWIVVPTGRRGVLERLEMRDDRLMVAGRVR
jgi:hypothetical protein